MSVEWATAFDSPTLSRFDDRAISVRDVSADEERWVTIGRDTLGRVLVAVYAWRGDHARIISARLATPAECRQYEEGL